MFEEVTTVRKNTISVTMNPSVDVTLWLDGLDFDATNRVVDETREMGGKGINVSRVIRSFGLPNLCMAVCGEENSAEFAAYLEQAGMRYELLKVEGAVRENLTLRHGEKTVKLNRKGPFVSVMMIGALMAMIESHIHPGDIVTFGGSLPENVSVTDYAELIMAVKQAGARVVIDSDLFTLEDYRRIGPWLIKPNIHELRHIVPLADETPQTVMAAAEQLYAAGVENVLVSLGAEGLLCVNGEGVTRAVPPAVEAYSTVGAGDSALAGYIIGEIKGYSLEQRVRLAAACGTACVRQEATILATPTTVEDLLNQVQVDTLVSRTAEGSLCV